MPLSLSPRLSLPPCLSLSPIPLSLPPSSPTCVSLSLPASLSLSLSPCLSLAPLAGHENDTHAHSYCALLDSSASILCASTCQLICSQLLKSVIEAILLRPLAGHSVGPTGAYLEMHVEALCL
ncbi:unnamed protein product [Arctogadus glacialis]